MPSAAFRASQHDDVKHEAADPGEHGVGVIVVELNEGSAVLKDHGGSSGVRWAEPPIPLRSLA